MDLREEEESPPTATRHQTPTVQKPATRNVLQPDAAARPRQATPESAAAEEDDEESIDDYMSRLMQRVRPGASESEAPSQRRGIPNRRGSLASIRRPARLSRRNRLFDHAATGRT